MSTRGLIGFYKNGQTKVTYNHSDSYPSYLGVNILNELRQYTIGIMNATFKEIILVKEYSKPTNKNIRKYITHSNDLVDDGNLYNWYVLLRNTQGTFKPYLDWKIFHMIDSQNFIKDSLFCEWAYIVNLKTKRLEVWQGCQTVENNNRYNIKTDDEYKSCKLLISFPLNDLPTNEEFLKACGD